DSDDGESAEVATLLGLRRWNDGFNALCLVEHLGWETMRQMKLANDDFDIDPEIIFVTQDLDHSSPRILVADGQSVISTSTTTPSRSSHSARRAASSPKTRSTDFCFFEAVAASCLGRDALGTAG